MIDVSFESAFTDERINQAMNIILERNTAPGDDGIKSKDLPDYWSNNKEIIVKSLLNLSYTPGIVVNKEIVQKNGKKRQISSINLIDRLILRIIGQHLADAIDAYFSPHLYSYRNGFSGKDAARAVSKYIEDGFIWVTELDIAEYFDDIPIDRMINKLAGIIQDEYYVRLIEIFLSCKVSDDGDIYTKRRGLVQGSPLSPVLSNIYLSDVDFYYDQKAHPYARYGDNIYIYSKTHADAEMALKQATELVESEELSINKSKGGIFLAKTRQCLGYEFFEKDNHIYVCKPVKHDRKVFNRWHSTSVSTVGREVHLINDGVLTRKDFTLLFENEDGKKYIPIEAIDNLNIYSNVIFSTGFFEFANERKLYISFINKTGEEVGTFIPNSSHRNYLVEAEQIALIKEKHRHLELAKTYQKANLFNLRAVLRYYLRRGDDRIISTVVDRISGLIDKINDCDDIPCLMMYEAQARQKYFECFNSILNDDGFKFHQRTRRPPKDPLNAMISFGNTLLYRSFAHKIRLTSSLDLRFGILHNSVHRSESLNLDLADLFKPILVDRTIFTLVNKNMINSHIDFREAEDGGYYLCGRGKRIFIEEYERKLSQRVSTKQGNKTYEELMNLEVMKIEKYFRNGEKYRPYKYVN